MHKNWGHLQVVTGDFVSLDCQHSAPVRGTDGLLCVHLLQDEENTEISPAGEAGWQEAAEKLEKSLREEFQQALKKKADKSEQQTV